MDVSNSFAERSRSKSAERADHLFHSLSWRLTLISLCCHMKVTKAD